MVSEESLPSVLRVTARTEDGVIMGVKQDRKSVVQGKSVDLGGRRIIKKKTTTLKNAYTEFLLNLLGCSAYSAVRTFCGSY